MRRRDHPQVSEVFSRLLLVERGTRRGRRALGVFSHAVRVLRWFRQAVPVSQLAGDAGIGISTCYQYLHEGIDVLAAQAPELSDVPRKRLARADSHVVLDGCSIAKAALVL